MLSVVWASNIVSEKDKLMAVSITHAKYQNFITAVVYDIDDFQINNSMMLYNYSGMRRSIFCNLQCDFIEGFNIMSDC